MSQQKNEFIYEKADDCKEIFNKEIEKKVMDFIAIDQYVNKIKVYDLFFIQTRLSYFEKPYVKVWVKVLDNKLWYDGKNRCVREKGWNGTLIDPSIRIDSPKFRTNTNISFILDIDEF